MNSEKLKNLFEEKFESKLGLAFEEWRATSPETEQEAYARCQFIDNELKDTYQEWFDATGEYKTELEDYREKLKIEYDLIEEMFGLELQDK